MSGEFAQYSENFEIYLDDAAANVRDIPKAASKERRDQLVAEAEGNVKDATRYLGILEGEARAGNPQQKRKMKDKIRTYRTKLDKVRADLEREQLLAQSRDRNDNKPQTNDKKAQMQYYADRQAQNNNHLDKTLQLVTETEQIGVNIDQNLTQQRNVLEETRVNVGDIREDVEEAAHHLSSLKRKNKTKSLCLYVTILLLFAAIVGTFIHAVTKGDSTPSSNSNGSGSS